MYNVFLCILFVCLSLFADTVYDKNKKANKLYEQGKYEEALSLYEEALLESPGEKKLSMNKGSSLYRLNDYDGAEESYKNALTLEDIKARVDLLYNMGNIYNMQGDQLAATGNPQAMEKYKAARDSYIKSLDLRQNDRDAKWNLQLTQLKIKELEKQQQQNNKDQNQQNQDKQNQDQQKDKKDQQKQQDKQDQQQKEQQDKEKKDQQQPDNQEDQQKQQQKPQPQPQKSEEDMEKEEALRLLRQYADDDKDLNKPKKQMRAITGKKPEKDW